MTNDRPTASRTSGRRCTNRRRKPARTRRDRREAATLDGAPLGHAALDDPHGPRAGAEPEMEDVDRIAVLALDGGPHRGDRCLLAEAEQHRQHGLVEEPRVEQHVRGPRARVEGDGLARFGRRARDGDRTRTDGVPPPPSRTDDRTAPADGSIVSSCRSSPLRRCERRAVGTDHGRREREVACDGSRAADQPARREEHLDAPGTRIGNRVDIPWIVGPVLLHQRAVEVERQQSDHRPLPIAESR